MLPYYILGKSLTELTNKTPLPPALHPSKSTSLVSHIPSQKAVDTLTQQQQAPSTLITSTSVSSNSGTTVVTNELLAAKKVVQTKTVSPPVLIQVKQESSSSSCVNPEFPKPHFITPSLTSEQQNKGSDNLCKALASSSQLVAIKSEPLPCQDHQQQNGNINDRNENTNLIHVNGRILKKEGK